MTVTMSSPSIITSPASATSPTDSQVSSSADDWVTEASTSEIDETETVTETEHSTTSDNNTEIDDAVASYASPSSTDSDSGHESEYTTTIAPSAPVYDNAFRYDRSSIDTGISSPTTAGYFIATPSTIPAHARAPLSAHPNYSDPLISVKDLLWLAAGIDTLVAGTLDRMGSMFAYNSVYLLKVVLDLQASYLAAPADVPANAQLDPQLVLRIARMLTGRLLRRDNSTVLSQELQLRTLISALTLVLQRDAGLVKSDVFAELFRHVSERDAEYANRYEEEGGAIEIGDNEYLTRFACDVIRCLPTDLPPMTEGLNKGAIHLLIATGFVNQFEDRLNRQSMDALFLRLTAAPSSWHEDMRNLHEGTIAAIALQHQAQSRKPPKGASMDAAVLAGEVARSIIERLEKELNPFFRHGRTSLITGLVKGTIKLGAAMPAPERDTQLFVCGLLDSLVQLVSTFPRATTIIGEAKKLAVRLIQRSDVGAFRYKAFELIMASTVGIDEIEYHIAMQDLESQIEETARSGSFFDTRSEDEKQVALERVEQLRLEKRYAADKWEQKLQRYASAADSMKRKILGQASDDAVPMCAPWEDRDVPNNHNGGDNDLPESPVITMFETDSTMMSPTCENATMTDKCAGTECNCAATSPLESCHGTFLSSRMSECTSIAAESPTLGNYNHPPIPPIPSHIRATNLRIQELTMSQLIPSPGMSMFDESPRENRKMSIDLPIQTFEQAPRMPQITTIPELESSEPSEHPFRRYHNASNLSISTLSTNISAGSSSVSAGTATISGGSPSIAELPADAISPQSTYPEPSMTRNSTLRRQSRVWQRPAKLATDKPLPIPDRASDAPEVVFPHKRAHSFVALQSNKIDMDRTRENASALGFRTPGIYQAGFEPLPPIVDPGMDMIPGVPSVDVDYEAEPLEMHYKLQSKDSCFATAITADSKHAVFLSPHSFQVFALPAPDEEVVTKPKFHYRLGDWEGLRKSKVPWQYKSMAVSDRYVVTISRERLQVHDLTEDCRVIFNDLEKGWMHSAVAISGDRLVVGLTKALRGENIGVLRLYRMNSPTYDGHRYERVGKDIHLPIPPSEPQDGPHIVDIASDGSWLTAGTPVEGYYFAWDIARLAEPRLLVKGKLRRTQGPGAEALTSLHLFPDLRHLLVTTFPAAPPKPTPLLPLNPLKPLSSPPPTDAPSFNGSYTETLSPLPPSRRAIIGVSPRVNRAIIDSYGRACAFLTKNGTLWTSKVECIEGDENIKSYTPWRSRKKLTVGIGAGGVGDGSVRFAPGGERVVAVDRKGGVVTASFRNRLREEGELVMANEIGDGWGMGPVAMRERKVDFGGYF